MNKCLFSISDLNRLDIILILKYSFFFEKRRNHNILSNTRLLIFLDSSSTRTRLSTEIAINELGGKPIVMFNHDSQLYKGEGIIEATSVISSYFDFVLFRTSDAYRTNVFKKKGNSIFINLLDPSEHPCQVISDLFTIIKHNTYFNDIVISWVGRNNNMFRSWLLISEIFNIKFCYFLPTKECVRNVFTKKFLLNNSSVIMTDSWNIIGEVTNDNFSELKIRLKHINRKHSFLFMHCLPANIGKEVDNKTLYYKNSIVFKQSYNKITTIKGIIYFYFKTIAYNSRPCVI
ncbi:hypothetical protein JSR06_00410 [Candidatus Vidania fulgoroideae]|uniref:Ornithine carbamoyltransferase n=1 Tax=Candidatus Vidania fulgoroideorum TaxID=881286 RepID=A0A974X7B6_9PROT|nr:hypothetical protein JSR06_00410 [Candidatus Vidania fulgoroideae]